MDIKKKEAELEKLVEHLNKTDNPPKGLDFMQYMEWSKKHWEGANKLRLEINLNIPKEDIEMKSLDKCDGDVFNMEDFKENVEYGAFIDSDGDGYYGTETHESNISVSPSDIRNGTYRKDFTHIIWYNK